MFSSENLPPIYREVGDNYLNCEIAEKFGVEQLKAILNQDTYLSDEEEEYWSDAVSYYLKFVRHHKSSSVLDFGKYSGKEISWLVENDFDYFEFCIREVDRFFVNRDYLIELSNGSVIFSESTIAGYTAKRTELTAYCKISYIRGAYQAWADKKCEQDPNYFDDDNTWAGNTNAYYDDNLDMDQQSQEYWDNS